MKGLWATTMKIFLFLESNKNVFDNKVSAALMCSHYSQLLVLFIFLAMTQSCPYLFIWTFAFIGSRT